MKTETIKTVKGELSCFEIDDKMINSVADFMELLVNCPTNVMVIKKNNLNDSFFDLKTGVAGEILQKVSNYKKRLIILGNFENFTSKSLNDLIYECNKSGTVIFAKDLNNAVNLLK